MRLEAATFGAPQEGVLARRQLAECGMSRARVARWVERGRLHRRHPGVYTLGHRRVTERGRLIGALI
ncbi:MAG TPA: type IV toxin-antitoxin system AbiEi family antitoxin domain-containing protein [Solirubrobacterales bacterium]